MTERIVVVAAVIARGDRFLLTLRQSGTHLADHWEFPGGKVEAGETLVDALRRELREELGVLAEVGECLQMVTHEYAERTVELHFFQCGFAGEPTAMQGQGMRWVERVELDALPFPEADRELIRLLSETAQSVSDRRGMILE